MAKRRRRAPHTSGKKSSGRKSGFPPWVKPTVAMVIGGGVGLIAMGLLPVAIAPYAPALGVLGSKMIGGGGWGKYAVTATVVGGVTLLSRRQTVQVAAGALSAARAALTSGGPRESGDPPSEDAKARGDRILRAVGLG